jgi:hypothetical protein
MVLANLEKILARLHQSIPSGADIFHKEKDQG